MLRIPFSQIPQELMTCMMHTENHVNNQAVIQHSLMELVRYHVSSMNGCTYCADMHFKEGIEAGESAQRLHCVSNWRETSFYDETEQALLAWTESVTLLNDSPLDRQSNFESLRKHFSTEDIAHLTLAIIQINAWTRLAKSFGFPAGSYHVGQFSS